jgi:PAS domain S-box-containing protein
MAPTLLKNDKALRDLSTYLLGELGLPAWIIDVQSFEILFSNRCATTLYGYTSEEFSQVTFIELFYEESKVQFIHQLTTYMDANDTYLHRKKNLQLISVELYLSKIEIEGTSYYQVTAVDVTTRVRLQERLEEERKRYKTYIDQSSEGIFCQEFRKPLSIDLPLEEIVERIRRDSYLAECNHAMARMYGYQHAYELEGLRTDQLLDLEDPLNIEYFTSFIKNGFVVSGAESHEKDRYGNSRYFLNNAIGIVENGFLKRVWGTQTDITQKKEIENKIRLLANLVEQTSDVLTAADLEYKPVSWNKAAEQVYGLKAEEVIGKNLGEMIKITYQNATTAEVRETVLREGEWRGEMFFVRPTDGKTITLLNSFKLLKDEQGEPLGCVIAGTDITERKEAELRLKESETRFRDVADSAPVMIWMSNPEYEITYVNKPWMNFTGISLEHLQKIGWDELIHPDDASSTKEKFDRHFFERKPVVVTYRLRMGDGSYKWVQETGIPRFLDEDTFIGFIGSVVDINSQKLKEEQLHYQANVLENVSDIIVTTDFQYRVLSWNKMAESYYGIKAEDAIGKPMESLVAFEYPDTERNVAAAELEKNGIWRGEILYKRSNGEPKYFLHTVKFVYDADGKATGVLSVGRDITERKEAEGQLIKSEQFYRTLIADSLDGMILMDASGIISFCSPSVRHVLGYSVEEVTGRNGFEFVHPDDLTWAFTSFTKEVEENPEIKYIVVRLLKKTGEWLWCMVRGHNLLSNPYVNNIVVYFHDDTLRKQATDALKESEERFRTLIRDLQIGVLLQDPEGNILMSNNAMHRMFDISEEGLIGKKIWETYSHSIHEDGTLFTLEERPGYRAIQTKQLVKDVLMGVLHPVTGKTIWIIINVDPILDSNGNIIHLVCSFTDLTERKKLEEKLIADQINHQKQLTQATIDGQEKERTDIGKELHDNIGQQLTTIKLFLDMAKGTPENATNEMMAMAQKGVSDVINEIRAMSRSLVPSTLKDLGLVDSIHELKDSINRTQSLKIELIHDEFDEDVLPENKKLTFFRIIQEQLNNIVKHSGATNVFITLRTNDLDVVLEISDDGNGFDQAIAKKGLGFTNIRNRIELFGGSSEVISSPGNGCLLRIFLPGAMTGAVS